ncbi:MAG: DNA translocase FtsK 4TM domain-containing protein [Myxococcota bacterium]
MAASRAAARRGRARGSKKASAATDFLARVGGEFGGLVLIGIALLAGVALATYSPEDPVFALAEVANRAGPAGATLAGWLFDAVGWGAVVVVAAVGWVGGCLVLGRGLPRVDSRFSIGSTLLLVSAATLPPILDSLAPGELGSARAGALGEWLVGYEVLLFSGWGALLVSSLLAVLGLLSVTGISAGAALLTLGRGTAVVGGVAAGLLGRLWQRSSALGVRLLRRGRTGLARIRGIAAHLTVWREQRARRARVAALEPEFAEEDPGAGEWAIAEEDEVSPVALRAAAREEKPDPLIPVSSSSRPRLRPGGRRRKEGAPDIVDHELERRANPSQEAFHFDDRVQEGPFKLPDTSIFQAPSVAMRGYDRDSLLMNSRILEKKLMDFGVKGRVVRVHPGPVITMYEFEPAPGIKVNKIVALSDDLAMALRAISIRIIAPLPGKSVVGIEIPNIERETVFVRSLLESESFRSSDAPLLMAMGKDIFGNCVHSDLAKMPHLLVAGATGTGKSVFLNAFLVSLLCRTSPHELKLLLIDPKLLELSIYEGIPHLIADVVTAPKRAAAALGGIVRKMEHRYQMMSAVHVRNIDQFNTKVEEALERGETSFRLRKKPGEEEGQEVAWCHMPCIVVVIDELADLMVLAAKDVEESLQRLAQMARAAGIHLVLATQRPSVDVLTGVIKANFPARVSFQVSSGTDSRTILDQKGAENLLGMGDMLFLPPGTSVLQRLHGPFVTEKEVIAVVAFLREQGKPVYDDELMAIEEDAEAQESRSEDVDERFDQAVAIVMETRNASISYLQRRLKIGYNRAARIIEQMENDGMVGPQEGTRPRSVYLRQPDEEDAD